jgi:phage-related protein
MSTEVGTAYVRILPSAKGFSTALQGEVGPGAAVAGKKGGGAFSNAFLAPMKGFAAPLAAIFGGAAVIGGIKSATTAASDLGESINAVKVSYGEAGEGVLTLSQKASQALGLSALDFNNLSVRFSSFSQTIAGEGGSVVGTLEQLTGRAADFASVMNLEVNDAAQLFQSGLAGETEPLRQFGIDMSAATVQAYAYANGIAEPGKELTEQQKIQARYGALMQQTAKTQGDFANTSGGLANTLRRLGAKWDDLKAKIGNAFLPVATGVASFFETTLIPVGEKVVTVIGDIFSGGGDGNGLAAKFGVIKDAVGAISEVLTTGNLGGKFAEMFKGEGAERLGSLLLGLRDTAITLWTALQEGVENVRVVWDEVLYPAFSRFVSLIRDNLMPGFAAIANFITTRVLPGIQELVAAYMENLHPAVMTVVGGLAVLWGAVQVAISWLWGKLMPVVLNIAGPIFTAFINGLKVIFTTIGTVVKVIATLVSAGITVATTFWNVATAAFNAMRQLVTSVSNGVSSAVDWIKGLPGKFIAALGNAGTLLYSVGQDIVRGLGNGLSSMLGWIKDKAKEIAKGAVDAAKNFLGINSPSRVFMEIGHNVGAGFAVGLGDTGEVEKAARSLVGASVVPVGVPASAATVMPFAGASSGSGRTINVYAPLESQVSALRRAERYDDILAGAIR